MMTAGATEQKHLIFKNNKKLKLFRRIEAKINC